MRHMKRTIEQRISILEKKLELNEGFDSRYAGETKFEIFTRGH